MEGCTQPREIARHLEGEILRGRLKPGARLDERTLAEHFGVSRTPIREALQWLAANGLVTLRGRQGACVAKLEFPDLLDAFYVIAEFEGMAARLAARRIQPHQRRKLEDCHRLCEQSALAGDHEAFFEENMRFHDIILEASGNRILQEQFRIVNALTSPYRRYVTYQAGRMANSIPEHAAIVKAISEGKGDEACELMRCHVNLLGEGLSDLLHLLSSSVEGDLLDAR